MASAWVAIDRNTLVAFSKMLIFILLHFRPMARSHPCALQQYIVYQIG